MAISLARDFKDFLKLLNSNGIEYLVVGGYAVGHYGYLRATGDLDVWVARSEANAQKLVEVLKEFGFDVPELRKELFLEQDRIICMGYPPVRIEVLTTISGVEFAPCFEARVETTIDGVPVNLISVEHLRQNKQASGRHKDLDDLENLPDP